MINLVLLLQHEIENLANVSLPDFFRLVNELTYRSTNESTTRSLETTMRPSLQGVCTSARHFLGRVILKRPGSSCKLHSGYCDSFGICVTMNSDDILRKLRDAFKRLFSREAMNSLWAWIKTEWYVFSFFLCVFCLLFVVLFCFYN